MENIRIVLPREDLTFWCRPSVMSKGSICSSESHDNGFGLAMSYSFPPKKPFDMFLVDCVDGWIHTELGQSTTGINVLYIKYN